MSKKNSVIAWGAFYVLVLGLLVYAASRTLHFVQNVMSDPTSGYLFLLSTGVGGIIWLYVYLQLAEGAKQRAIAFVMGIVDMLGEMCLVYADTMLVGSSAGLVKMTDSDMHNFIVVSVGTVTINILAGYFFKLFDLKAEQEQHAQDLVDHVTEATMKHLNTPEAQQQLVSELMPTLSESIRTRVSQEIFKRSGQYAGVPAAGTVFQPPAELHKNEALTHRFPLSKVDEVKASDGVITSPESDMKNKEQVGVDFLPVGRFPSPRVGRFVPKSLSATETSPESDAKNSGGSV